MSPPVGHTVVVANSYFTALDAKQTQKMRPFPPLATLYVASNLRSQGFEVHVFDAVLASGEHEFAAFVQDLAPDVVVLFEDNFNFLSKMCLRRTREAACTMVGMAQAAGAYVVVAGSDVTDHPELYLAAGAHVAVVGEGDHTVVELLEHFAAERRPDLLPDHVPGIVLRAAPAASAPAATSVHARDPRFQREPKEQDRQVLEQLNDEQKEEIHEAVSLSWALRQFIDV